HLHFVAMEQHRDRLLQMGEEPWRVHVTGDPALDHLRDMTFMKQEELAKLLRLDLRPPVLVATYHPTTLGSASAEEEVLNLLAALDGMEGTVLFTYPGADCHNQVIVNLIQEFVQARPNVHLRMSLGQDVYYSLLAEADLLVGNSSSGIWEAPTFRLPAVNV